jgi:hypothetical protein
MILSKSPFQPKRKLLTEAAVPSKQVQALEIFFEFEQFVAKAGRDVVAVTVDFVYVSQKVIAAEAEAVNAEAQGSVLALSHPSTRGAARAPRKRNCFIILLAFEFLTSMERSRTLYGEIVRLISKDIKQLEKQTYNTDEGHRNMVERDTPSLFSRVILSYSHGIIP